jgi:hypothetical protein
MTNIALLPQQSSSWWSFLLQGFAGVNLGLMLATHPPGPSWAPSGSIDSFQGHGKRLR